MTFKVFGEHDENTLKQMEVCMQHPAAVAGVLCADGHLGYAHPIGGVVAYEDHISLSGVGFDIGCGNMAVKLDCTYADLDRSILGLHGIVDDIAKHVSFGVGRPNNVTVEHWLFDDVEAWQAAGVEPLRGLAQAQLGTVGSGNHYVDLFTDENGYVWIGVHFGSRGLGHKIATKAFKAVGAVDSMMAEPSVVSVHSELGREYLAGMELAGDYAYAGREWAIERVRQIIGADVMDTIHNHHNYAWRECVNGQNCWVVRKGATPAAPGQRGFVGGSMGDDAVILEGVSSLDSREALFSTVHGAGRVMSRTEARGKIKKKTGEVVKEPRISREAMNDWLRERGVIRVGGDVDEAPQAYRRLPDVLKAHEGTINILHTLRPFAVLMAGSDEFDPYKD